jgi:glycosyltransferase involved in cell wall biosynthesis
MQNTLNVFVHLSSGQDALEWKNKWLNKQLIGINDISPYGYSRANEMGCKVAYSKTKDKSPLHKLLRLVFRVLFGFDYFHAKNNQSEIYEADVIWTHTETQFLGIALLFLLNKHKKRPKLIGQSVWLMDHWDEKLSIKKWFYRLLINQVDLLTFLSTENAEKARKHFPKKNITFVHYGIPNEFTRPIVQRNSQPIKVLSLGNDKHRDWDCLVKALGNQDHIQLTVISQTLKPNSVKHYKNINVVTVDSNEALIKHFDDASIMVIPLKENIHASGITAIEEGALLGLPMIATDTGGLKAYFDDQAVYYVSHSDPEAILNAVNTLANDAEKSMQLARNAQDRIMSATMGCSAYIRKHVELSRELLV